MHALMVTELMLALEKEHAGVREQRDCLAKQRFIFAGNQLEDGEEEEVMSTVEAGGADLFGPWMEVEADDYIKTKSNIISINNNDTINIKY